MRNLLVLVLAATVCAMPSYARTRRTRAIPMEATAFARRFSPTAAGTVPHQGIVAADPTVLPLGSRIRITGAGGYNGVYIVTDTGDKIVGRRIDLYMPTTAEARRFGRKIIYVRVLVLGSGKDDARATDLPAHAAPH